MRIVVVAFAALVTLTACVTQGQFENRVGKRTCEAALICLEEAGFPVEDEDCDDEGDGDDGGDGLDCDFNAGAASECLAGLRNPDCAGPLPQIPSACADVYTNCE